MNRENELAARDILANPNKIPILLKEKQWDKLLALAEFINQDLSPLAASDPAAYRTISSQIAELFIRGWGSLDPDTIRNLANTDNSEHKPTYSCRDGLGTIDAGPHPKNAANITQYNLVINVSDTLIQLPHGNAHWIPIFQNGIWPYEAFFAFYRLMQNRQPNAKTLVHCTDGKSLSPAMVGFWLLTTQTHPHSNDENHCIHQFLTKTKSGHIPKPKTLINMVKLARENKSWGGEACLTLSDSKAMLRANLCQTLNKLARLLSSEHKPVKPH
jgi:hypothetical protein